MKKPIVAIMYDFDKTLCTKDMQEYAFIPSLGMTASDFWSEVRDMTDREDECELGYWLGKPFWGRGYMPEAVAELLRRAFEDLDMTTVWCGYYDGNSKSKRVQEKAGFLYHHTCNSVPVPLMNDVRIGHTNYMTREQWEVLHTPRAR